MNNQDNFLDLPQSSSVHFDENPNIRISLNEHVLVDSAIEIGVPLQEQLGFPQLPQLLLSSSDDCADTLIPRSLSSSETVGIEDQLLRKNFTSVASSVHSGKRAEPRKVSCSRCKRVVERVDYEFGQCIRCNADEIRIAGIETLIDSVEADSVARFIAQLRELK